MTKIGKYVAVYDISDDKERHRAAKVLEGFGFRVQASVFECELSPGLRKRLIKALEGLDLETGCVFLYRRQARSDKRVVGRCAREFENGANDDFAFVV